MCLRACLALPIAFSYISVLPAIPAPETAENRSETGPASEIAPFANISGFLSPPEGERPEP